MVCSHGPLKAGKKPTSQCWRCTARMFTSASTTRKSSLVAASHDAGQTFTTVSVNPNDRAGLVFGRRRHGRSRGQRFFWMDGLRTPRDARTRPVSIYVSRSADGGRTWSTTSAGRIQRAPDCEAQICETGFWAHRSRLPPTPRERVYALWNAGCSERRAGDAFTFRHPPREAQAGLSGRMCRARRWAVEHCFPGNCCGRSGRCSHRMDGSRRARETGRPRQPSLWNTYYRSSTNGGATWSAETPAVRGRRAATTTFCLTGFRFPFGDYFGLAIDSDNTTHAVWGEGRNYKSPGSIWYAQGR